MRLTRVLETGTIRSRLLGALVLLAALPVLVLVVSLVLLGRMSGDARRIELAASLRMGGFVVAAQIERHLASPRPDRAVAVYAELERMEDALVALESGAPAQRIAVVRDGEARARLAAVRATVESLGETAARILAEQDVGALPVERRDDAADAALTDAYRVLMATQELVVRLESRSSAAMRRLWTLQAIAVGVAIVVLVLTLWAVNRYVLQPVPPLLAALQQIGAGRYGVGVEVRGENELSRVARGFNAMSADLERTHHELVMKQAEILEKNAELERANRLKSNFVANMSHELRTPLHAIIGYTKLLRSEIYGPLPAAVHEPLQGIDETSAALLRLINDILDVAKIEAGRMDLHLTGFRIEEVVREVADMLQPLAIAKGLELVALPSPGLPLVTSDRDKVRRILLNLGGNAVKFTRRGRVEIELRPAGPATGGGAPGDWFEIAVHDTGVGIATKDHEIIFEDFRQIDGSATREHGGSGLGLAISRRLARHLGGDIRVESAAGQGSTFLLRLPVFVHIDAGERALSRNPSPPLHS